MAEPRKNFKVSNSETTAWKKNKNKFKVQTGWDIFKLFLNIYNSTLKSMVIQCIHKVFEKEMVWNQKISFTNKIHKGTNISTQIQLSSKCKYKLIQDGRHMTFDIWKCVTSCGSTEWFEVSMKGKVRAKNSIMSSFAVHIWAHWGLNTKFSIDFALELEISKISRYKFC